MSCDNTEYAENLVVFDTDVGTDDAWALLMLLRAEEKLQKVKILAITCAHGNAKIQHVVRNVFRILDTVKREDIPVFKGVSSPILKQTTEAGFFHGEDGFGNVYPHDQDDRIPDRLQKQHAVTAMYEIASKYPKRVTFILVGPLTNFAICLKMYSDFAENVKDVYIMGGNRKGVGNITACAEFNFYFDPEAAHIVLDEDTLQKTILPWEPCLPKISGISLDWRLHELSSINNHITNLMDPVEKKCYTKSAFKTNWMPCDAFLTACFLFPQLMVKKQSMYHVSLELTGSHTRGQMILDHIKKKKDNCRIIEQIDLENFKAIALWTAGHDVEF